MTTTPSMQRPTPKLYLICVAVTLIACFAGSALASRIDEGSSNTGAKGNGSARPPVPCKVETPGDKERSNQPTMEQMMELADRLKKLEEVVQKQQEEIEHERSLRAAEHGGTRERGTGEGAPVAVAAGQGSGESRQAAKTPISGEVAAAPAKPAPAAVPVQEDAPLSLRIGRAAISPVGFADVTVFFRSTNVGSSLGTNFGSIPFSNTAAGRSPETRLTAQRTQIGFRADVDVRGAHVVGFLASDFFGAAPGNVAVPGNTNPNRMLLAFVDVRKDKFEVLGGQAWSLMTPGRSGISPFMPDIFVTKDVDINFQAGLVAARNGQIRFVYHPSDRVALAVSAENPEQYTGGSLGAGTITLPSALVGPYTGQLNNGTTGLSVPNLHPDIVAKVAFDPKWNGRDFHIEAAGLVRSFSLFNPLSNRRLIATGGGALLGLNLELVKNLRFISHAFYSDGGGRYTYGLAPDLVVRSDGSPSLIHSAATVTGIEAQITDRSSIYGYYGGVYIQRNTVLDPSTLKPVGYGFPGSPSSNNRTIQEWTVGFNRTIWKNPEFGGLQFITQYSYLSRNPWAVAPGQPVNPHVNMLFLDLRYELPGAPPRH